MTIPTVLMLVLLGAAAPVRAEPPPASSTTTTPRLDVLFVPTPVEVVEAMLSLAGVRADDVVYDLGCGDGRIVIAAARRYGARGVGVDADPVRIAESRAAATRAGVAGRVRFVQQDLFATDLSPASVVTLYLLGSLNERLRPKLLDELRPGARVVSHSFSMGAWEPEERRLVPVERSERTILSWVVPANVSGRWMLRGAGGATGVLDLEQGYQRLAGTVRLGETEWVLREGTVSGVRLSLVAVPRMGRGARLILTGRAAGERLVDVDAGEAGAWTGERAAGTGSSIDRPLPPPPIVSR
jgi:SAM-dependent methyltransferase